LTPTTFSVRLERARREVGVGTLLKIKGKVPYLIEGAIDQNGHVWIKKDDIVARAERASVGNTVEAVCLEQFRDYLSGDVVGMIAGWCYRSEERVIDITPDSRVPILWRDFPGDLAVRGHREWASGSLILRAVYDSEFPQDLKLGN
jgi:hypothetical protein